MTKKQDFIRSEQSRDKHPESHMRGSAADVGAQAADATGGGAGSQDKQPPHTGKVANDHNKAGQQKPTQKNEGRRTPESRHDRQTLSGGPQNVIEARTGGKGGGRGPNGAG